MGSETSPTHTFTILATVHHDSSRFDLEGKIGMEKRKSSITTVSRNVEMVSVLFPYQFTTIHDSSAMHNMNCHGGTTNAHDASTVRYDARTIQSGSATRSYECNCGHFVGQPYCIHGESLEFVVSEIPQLATNTNKQP